MPNHTAKALNALAHLSSAQLVLRWTAQFGKPPAFRTNRELLLRGIAYHLQEKANGTSNKRYARQLRKLVDDFAAGEVPAGADARRIKPGTRLIREWQGKTHTVTATNEGFEYRGRRYRSLSVIAREITGTRWSGPLFFGLKSLKQVKRSDDGE